MFFILTYAFCLSSCAQNEKEDTRIQPYTETLLFQLGNKEITVLKSTYDEPKGYAFIQLHDNESTAEEAAIHFLEKEGGLLLSIENDQARNITFSLKGKQYTFDPNRMFSEKGIASTLKLYGAYSAEAAAAVEKFAAFLLEHLPDSSLIIALHNNTDDQFSVLSYQQDQTYRQDSRHVYITDEHDVDNFFFTTDEAIHEQLQRLNYNTVLQDNHKAADDGSLSVYMGKRNLKYVNVEAQYGHDTVQRKMIYDLVNIVHQSLLTP